MKIETVSCLVSSRQDPSHEHFGLAVHRTGPDAVPVSEIPILQAMHGFDAISMVKGFGAYETSRQEEWERLHRKYKREYVARVYPTMSSPMTTKIEDLHLERSQMDTRVKETAKVDDAAAEAELSEKETIKARLAELNFPLPFGNFGLPKLRAFLKEAESKADA